MGCWALRVAMAAALAACASAVFTRVMLTPGSNGGRCLDGSPAGFYVEKGSPDLFVIYLEGGGACYTEQTCKDRSTTALGTSTVWDSTIPGKGSYSPEKRDNPDFYAATRVYVPYCTGDVHGGRRTTNSTETYGFFFDGHLNFVLIVEELIKDYGLASAKDVLLTGASAGGIGTFLNADPLSIMLPHSRVWAAPQAGWFFPGDTADHPNAPYLPPSDWAHWSQGKVGGPNASFPTALWDSLLPPDCASTLKPAWHCGSIHVAYKYIRTPLLVLENMYDTNQLIAQLGMPSKSDDPKTLAYVRYFGDAMRKSTAQVVNNTAKPHDGIFLASCFDHVGVGVDSKVRIGSVSITEILGDWFFQRNTISHRIVDTCNDTLPCNPSCDAVPPSMGTCNATLHALCDWATPKHCLACAKAHEQRLKDAGCTIPYVVKECKEK